MHLRTPRDQRDQVRVYRADRFARDAHEFQILRHEHACHAHGHDGQTRRADPNARQKEKPAADTRAGTQVERPGPDPLAAQSTCTDHSHDEHRQQSQRRRAMPRIEVPVPKIGEKTEKAGQATQRQRPPCPGFSSAQRKQRQPHIQNANGDQDPAEGNTIVNHEVQEAAAL